MCHSTDNDRCPQDIPDGLDFNIDLNEGESDMEYTSEYSDEENDTESEDSSVEEKSEIRYSNTRLTVESMNRQREEIFARLRQFCNPSPELPDFSSFNIPTVRTFEEDMDYYAALLNEQ